MIFFIEAIAACALFTLGVVSSLLKDPMAWISDYPPKIQARAKELGLIPKEKKGLTKAELVRKLVGSLLIVIWLAVVLVFVNGATTFRQGFWWSYGLYNVVAWYDAIVIDCLWFCHSKRVILPGTEDLQKSYRDYWFHIRQSLLGVALGIPVCLLAGLGVLLLA